MTSKVQICNLALLAIGAESYIQSIDEHSPQAKACKQAYDDMVEAALADHDWNFATQYDTLALVGEPPGDWAYQYAYPNGCVRAREIIRPSRQGYDPIPFTIASASDGNSRVILTDEAEAQLRYTGLITNPGMYPPIFVEALALRLSMAITMPLTRKQKLLEQQTRLYQGALIRAAAASGNERQEDRPEDADWIKDRE
ncbi:MAG: hypothetical protein DBP02_02185 [gamma proteobacterium symbiont of Ctena orbiculata]|nr:MAG: hypothetical protein DBP02_02185 [gamma proteobacterium symbiont of Ctena orbiculata]